MSDVICLGEVLVDWVSTAPSRSLESARAFEKLPGGAPANVAVGLARLGVSAAFAGGISTDPFGQWLRALIRRDGVDVGGAVEFADTNTRMAFVLVDEHGERRLATFTTAAVADTAYAPDNARALNYRSASIFHFGSVTLACEPCGEATRLAARLARDAGCVVSFDPNIRLPLWSSAEVARRAVTPLLSTTDVLKVSEEEVAFLTSDDEVERGAELLWERHRPALLAVTLGARGAFLRHRCGTFAHPGFKVDVRDTTGAGDAFVAGLLRAVFEELNRSRSESRRDAVEAMTEETVQAALRSACALGALATTRAGAMAALPSAAQLEAFMQSRLEVNRLRDP